MARLLVIRGADEGKQFELAEEVVTLGRDGTNRIRLCDTEVSRRHAEFRHNDGACTVLDKSSANGTYVNNQRVQEAVLQPGDHILVGQTTLVYSTGRTENQPPPGDLAEKIHLISPSEADLELSSAIIKTIGETEGSRILSHPERGSPWLKTALANLSIMYEASQAVSHILDLGELLTRILELIFRSINADRGCFMLRGPGNGELEPKAVRARGDKQEKVNVSKTIMEHVLDKKEGVLVSDAAHDERFSTGQSIVRFGIREVICVPMKGRHETLGVLYLDTHMGPREIIERPAGGKFTEEHLALAIAVAHQAALAVEETRYHQAMLQAERLAAIGQTIAALSHHIKNILQGLRSGSEILKMGMSQKNDAMVEQGWRIAEKNQAKIYHLVMDMLSYSKEREPAVEPTNLNQVVQDVVELMGPRAKEMGINMELKLQEDLPAIPVDPEGIHRALLNIVGNALDALEDRPDPQLTIGTRLDPGGGFARIVVIDNGTGIVPEKVGEIFKPFVSTKGAKGTGLGLAVSRKILREHGGDILVRSQVGEGSRFTLRLPVKSPIGIDPSATNDELPIYPPPELD